MTKSELDKILSDHKEWLCNEGGKKADLRGAILLGADLRGADLREADLRGANISWISNNLIAEILRQEAKNDIKKRQIAGLVLISLDWCCNDFMNLKISAQLKKWAISTLLKYDVDGSLKKNLEKYNIKTEELCKK